MSVISVHVLYIQYTDVTTTWTTVMKLTNKSPAPTSSALLAPKFVLRVHSAGASDTHKIRIACKSVKHPQQVNRRRFGLSFGCVMYLDGDTATQNNVCGCVTGIVQFPHNDIF